MAFVFATKLAVSVFGILIIVYRYTYTHIYIDEQACGLLGDRLFLSFGGEVVLHMLKVLKDEVFFAPRPAESL